MSDLVERVAECIFEAMRWAVKNANTTQGKPPTWSPNGNSFAQEEARRAARAALEASSQRIKELEAEVERLRAVVAKYEGVDAGSWFYPDGDRSSDACCHSPEEVLDEIYFHWRDGPKTGVYSIERAAALPKIYAAVRAYSEAEKDERDSDDEYDVTFHLTADEARALLQQKETSND